MSRFVMPLQSAFGQRVVPFDGAKLFFFDTGTSTPKDTFSDAALTTPNPNPVVADANGLFPDVFLGGGVYKAQLKDKNDVQSWEEDPVEASLAASSAVSSEDTVATMKAGNYSSGQQVRTSGYTTKDDGGDAVYLIKTSAEFGGTPDGFGDHTLDNGNVAVLQVGREANVAQFGAQSGVDGSSPDATASIQAAWDSGRSIYFPRPHYTIDTALNFTNRSAGGRYIRGEAGGISRNGSVIHMNTGGVGVDMTGTQRVQLKDLTLDSTDSALTTPSTVGLLNARSTTSQFSQFNNFDNITISMHTDATANGGNGTVGCYNVASELTEYKDIWFSADNPLVIAATNVFSIASVYQTIGGPTSCSNIRFTGTCALTARDPVGFSLFMSSVAVVEGMLYLARSGTLTDTFAIKATGSMDAIKLFCQVEFNKRVALLGNGCNGLDIHATIIPGSLSPFGLDSGFVGITRCKLHADNILVGAATAPYILEGDASDSVSDCDLIASVWSPATAPTNVTNTPRLRFKDLTEEQLSVSRVQFENTGSASASDTITHFQSGTFNPTVEGSSVAGTASYTVRGGTFQRINDVVHVTIALVWTSATGTGNIRLGAMPFTANSAIGKRAALAVYANNLAAGAITDIHAYIQENTDKVVVRQYAAGTSTEIPIVAAGTLFVSGHYFV